MTTQPTPITLEGREDSKTSGASSFVLLDRIVERLVPDGDCAVKVAAKAVREILRAHKQPRQVA